MTDELIARLEAAEEGSRELDYAVAEVALADMEITYGRGDCRITVAEAFAHQRKHKIYSPEYVGRCISPDGLPHYTTSLDAKLPWENIEEVALHDVVEGEPLGTVWEAWHRDANTGKRTMGSGRTEVLARRVAALKAREEPHG